MIKIQLMDYIFSLISVRLVNYIDPITKSEFEKQIVMLNLIFIILNHFSPMILIRIFLVEMYGKCNYSLSPNDRAYEHIKKLEEAKNINKTLNVDQEAFLTKQTIALGCIREIQAFFTVYIIMNFLLSILRVIIMRIKVKKLKAKNKALSKVLEKASDQKMEKWQLMKSKFVSRENSLLDISQRSINPEDSQGVEGRLVNLVDDNENKKLLSDNVKNFKKDVNKSLGGSKLPFSTKFRSQ